MSIHVFIDQFKIGVIEGKAYDALAQTGYVLRDDIREEQIVPRDTGALQGEKFVVDTTEAKRGLVVLSFEGPYARRLYYHPEYNFQRGKNPNAGAAWLEPYISGGKKDFVANEFAKAFRRRIGQK